MDSILFRFWKFQILWICLDTTASQSIECYARKIPWSLQNIFEFCANGIPHHSNGSMVHVRTLVSETNLNWKNSVICNKSIHRFWISRTRGKFTYSSIIRIPALLGGWSILLAQDKVRLLFGHTAATIVSIWDWQ